MTTVNLDMQNANALSSGHRHEIIIEQGGEADVQWFLELDEQTSWDSLPTSQRAQLCRETWRESLQQTNGLMLSCEGNVFFIARDQRTQTRLGMLWFGPRHNALSGEHEGWIYSVCVSPQHRNCGVGKRLIAHAEDYARDQGFEVIGLSVASHNGVARELYERLEYSQSNVLMRKNLASVTQVTA